MAQKEVFKDSEGDQWFRRNRESCSPSASKDDQIVNLLKQIELSSKTVLEIGCCNGCRLDFIREACGAQCWGIDPSREAIEDGKGRFPEITLQVGTADDLPFDDDRFDVIIFGFCLYLCDRADLFRIACEADRCLRNGGVITVMDFYPPFPYRNRYSHREDIYSYKMDYSRMFVWNPAYVEMARVVLGHSGSSSRDDPDERVAISVLRKYPQFAYPESPFLRD